MSIDFPDTLLKTLSAAHAVAAFTGAGVSAESGVPTFRGNEGIWTRFKPEELANLAAFMKNPELVWEWYRARKTIIAGVEPNAAHKALAALEELYGDVTIVTQNIDNLHRRAGSRTVVELHGNIERNYCMTCGTPASNASVLSADGAPRCEVEGCGGLVRPDVVWFGEMLPEDEWDRAVRAMARADVVLSIGTSGVVYPAASLPLTAKQQGALLVEINPEPTPLTPHADVFLRGPAGSILPDIVSVLRAHRAVQNR